LALAPHGLSSAVSGGADVNARDITARSHLNRDQDGGSFASVVLTRVTAL